MGSIIRSLVLASVCLGLSANIACAQDAKAKPRVLIFAGAPMRDVQFLCTVLLEKQAELTVLVQTGDKADPVMGEKPMLTAFPDRLGADPPGKKGMSLSNYDVIIAFDPDWSKMSDKQYALLRDWVMNGGGFMYAPGANHSYQLARPNGRDSRALQELVPVTLKDTRLHGLGLVAQQARPFMLSFSEEAKNFSFLKLDDKEDGPTGGWSRFFGQDDVDPKQRRGIHHYHPVEKVRADATVLASVILTRSEHPYFVTMPFGKGKTMFLGSAETWRLRQFNEDYHQRFWTRLTAYLAEKTEKPKQKNSPKSD